MDQEFANILQYELKKYIDMILGNYHYVPSSLINSDMNIIFDVTGESSSLDIEIRVPFEFYLIETFSSFNIKKQKSNQMININIKSPNADNLLLYEDTMLVIMKFLKIG